MITCGVSRCRVHVKNREPFNAGNVYARALPGNRYAVYSYGEHFPLYIHVPGEGWYRNTDSYSATTSKHRSQCNPCEPCTDMDTTGMRILANGGHLTPAA